MQNTRLAILKQYYEEDSSDPFNGYALAMEYMNSDLGLAQKHLEELLQTHADYLPTYYQAGMAFSESRDSHFVGAIYEKGLELALVQQNNKAYQELQRAYRGYLDEEM
jgi:hypothetical protein